MSNNENNITPTPIHGTRVPNYILNPDTVPAYTVIAINFEDHSDSGMRRIDAKNIETAKAIASHPSLSNFDDIVIRNNATAAYVSVTGYDTDTKKQSVIRKNWSTKNND